MASKIYTKRGDAGETYLRGNRVSKDSLRVIAIGEIDELSSVIGLCKSEGDELDLIQKDLFAIGTLLSSNKEIKLGSRIKELERGVDAYSEKLPKLDNFILPKGCLHVARAVCRRAERAVVSLSKEEPVPGEVLAYLNRLSDFLFTLARYSNNLKGLKEEVWK